MNIKKTKDILGKIKDMSKFDELMSKLRNKKAKLTLVEDKDVELPQMPDLSQLPPGANPMEMMQQLMANQELPAMAVWFLDDKVSTDVFGYIHEYIRKEIIVLKSKLREEILGRKQGTAKKAEIDIDEVIEDILNNEEPEIRIAVFKFVTSDGVVEGKYKTDGRQTEIEPFKIPNVWGKLDLNRRTSMIQTMGLTSRNIKERDIISDLVYYFGAYGIMLDIQNIVELKILD